MNMTTTINTTMSTNMNQVSTERSYAPYLLAILPALAVVGSMITLYFVLRYPDQVIPVDPVTEIHDESGSHQHVVNSVTPPLH
jgi:hypothetical protein